MSSRITPLILLVVISFFSINCQRPMAVGDADKALLLQASELIPYGYGFQRITQHEIFKKMRDFDGTIEVEYEFETPESELEHPLYLDVVVTVARKTSDAKVTQGAEKIGVLAGLKLRGIVQEERTDFYNFGDSSSFFVLKKDGKPVGNYFSTRQGTKTYTVILAGMYIDDSNIWKELVEPKLKSLAAYKP